MAVCFLSFSIVVAYQRMLQLDLACPALTLITFFLEYTCFYELCKTDSEL